MDRDGVDDALKAGLRSEGKARRGRGKKCNKAQEREAKGKRKKIDSVDLNGEGGGENNHRERREESEHLGGR